MTVWWLKSTRCNNFIEHYFGTKMKTFESWWCGNVVFKIVFFFTLHLYFIPIQIVTWCHHNVWLWNVNQNSNKHSTGIETILKLLLSEKEVGKKIKIYCDDTASLSLKCGDVMQSDLFRYMNCIYFGQHKFGNLITEYWL